MHTYREVTASLLRRPHGWLVTGAAGFIGSNLVETLLKLEQRVVGLDNFATGFPRNLAEIEASVSPTQWRRFIFIEGDIRDLDACRRAVEGVDFVLHQAALGSVPRSIKDPIKTNETNVNGFLNMLVAARDAGVARFVYAVSSSIYGDHPGLPKVEDQIGKPLSPYAVSKYVNELYAGVFARSYGFDSIGLRYFNVFGKRQDPDGAYAAVIPKWVAAMMQDEPVYINGDGQTSRDFSYVENTVQANLLAATTRRPEAVNQVYNIAVNERTTLNALYEMLRQLLVEDFPHLRGAAPRYRAFRHGDIAHSQADITKAQQLLGFTPTHRVEEGLHEAISWYKMHLAERIV